MRDQALKIPGHKRAKVHHIVKVACECGWESAGWYGKGASEQAHREWYGHLEKCKPEKKE